MTKVDGVEYPFADDPEAKEWLRTQWKNLLIAPRAQWPEKIYWPVSMLDRLRKCFEIDGDCPMFIEGVLIVEAGDFGGMQ